MSTSSTATIPISIKYGSTTYHMHLDNQPDLSKNEQFNMIANHIHIPSARLKLIHKGKRFTKENWHELILTANMNFLSIGEQEEDETDVSTKDIDCLMHQLNVDRNTAVKALKLYPDMIAIEIRENLSLFDDAFSVHKNIPEFQVDPTTYDQLFQRITAVKNPLILVAYDNCQPVGYLIGYERFSSFYIWITGILPTYRRQRIFFQLIKRTEEYATKLGYQSLTIKTRNSFKSMLLFLIRHSFKFIDIDKRDTIDNHRLILQKYI